jgi:hypothetical protein
MVKWSGSKSDLAPNVYLLAWRKNNTVRGDPRNGNWMRGGGGGGAAENVDVGCAAPGLLTGDTRPSPRRHIPHFQQQSDMASPSATPYLCLQCVYAQEVVAPGLRPAGLMVVFKCRADREVLVECECQRQAQRQKREPWLLPC